MKWKNKGKEFSALAQEICNNENRYYIWGAGIFGESFYHLFKKEISIKGFIDSNPQKTGTKIDNLTIYKPDVLESEQAHIKVIVASGWIQEIYSQLNSFHLIAEKDYFHANDFMSIYMFYKKNKVYTVSLNLPITTKCTLKCKKCMALIPYAKEKYNVPLDTIREELETYFLWVDQVAVLGLGGGDVLLHPQIYDILEYIGSHYLEKIQRIELYTNAIILPSDKLLSLCEKYNVVIRFSDYTNSIPGKQKIRELKELLKKHSLQYDCCTWQTWYDIGFPQENNGIDSTEELIEHYNKCSTKLCAITFHKRLYFCSVCASAVMAGYCDENLMDSFNLMEYNEDKRIEFLEFNSGYNTCGYLSYCKKCNGYQNINKKFVKVAEQLD